MAKTVSEDLRTRVTVAVEAGMSRRAAAERFGVAVASAIRWVHEWRTTGAFSAKSKGGDQRSHRIEAHRTVILAAIDAQVDITLVELAELLRRDHRVSFAPSTIWRFLDRHAITKKKRRTPASRRDQTSPRGAGHGSTASLISIRSTWSSSTKPVLQRKWRACEVAPNVASVVARPFRMATGRPRPLPARCGCTV